MSGDRDISYSAQFIWEKVPRVLGCSIANFKELAVKGLRKHPYIFTIVNACFNGHSHDGTTQLSGRFSDFFTTCRTLN